MAAGRQYGAEAAPHPRSGVPPLGDSTHRSTHSKEGYMKGTKPPFHLARDAITTMND